MLLKIKIWLLLWFFKTIKGYSQVSTKLLYAQVLHETGNFTSNVFKENNNLFGMRQAKIRKNTATGTNRSHATYKNHRQSIVDYFLRQSYFKVPNTNDNQYMVLTFDSGYAEDKSYIQKWNTIYKGVKVPLGVKLLAYGGLFFLLLTLFFLIFSKPKNR